MILTQTHGLMDYAMGLILIASPFIFDFTAGCAEMWLPISLGFTVILYNLISANEYGLVPVISMKSHLWLDSIVGVFLALSPWIFGFAHFVFLPHMFLGLTFVLAAALTEKVPLRSSGRIVQKI